MKNRRRNKARRAERQESAKARQLAYSTLTLEQKLKQGSGAKERAKLEAKLGSKEKS